MLIPTCLCTREPTATSPQIDMEALSEAPLFLSWKLLYVPWAWVLSIWNVMVVANIFRTVASEYGAVGSQLHMIVD